MRRFRRTGSPTRYFVDGDPADPADLDLLKALQQDRFRPLGADDGETESTGWIARSDPSGKRFEPQEIVHGPYLAFSLRVDRKRVSAALVKIEVESALRAASREGGKLPREQKKQIAEEAKRSLLARALPQVSLVDCLWNCGDRALFVFASGAGALDAVTRQFRETFRRPLLPASATAVARRLRLGDAATRALEGAAPADFTPRREREGSPLEAAEA